MSKTSKKPVILLVDDEVDLCDTMATTFNIRGFETLVAYNGKQAFEILKTTPVDVVLSDLQMPNGTGLELVQWIRKEGINIPIVAFMSGYSQITPKDISELGVSLFFDKPFPINTVIKMINSGIKRNTCKFIITPLRFFIKLKLVQISRNFEKNEMRSIY